MVKYRPLKEISIGGALSQAITALDIAARLAIDSGDTDCLLRVADKYVEIATKITMAEEPDEEPSRQQLGFGLEIVANDN